MLEKENVHLEEKVSKYWHRWRKSKRNAKKLLTTCESYEEFTDDLIEENNDLKQKTLQVKSDRLFWIQEAHNLHIKLLKFKRDRNLLTGKFKKKNELL